VIDLRLGDCLETLRAMPDSSVHSVVTDPPYGLGKEPDPREVLRAWLDGSEFKPGGAGFMGKSWDAFVPSPLVWSECLRVLKPGGHLLAFAGSRTYDWIVMGVRLAGFEVRDQLMWLYGSGFPKSMNVSKAIDKAAGADRQVVGYTRASIQRRGLAGAFGSYPEDTKRVPVTTPATDDARKWEGWGTALKPSFEPVVWARKPLNSEDPARGSASRRATTRPAVPDHCPIVLARKPLVGTVAANVLEHGTGAINVDACRVGFSTPADESESKGKNRHGDFGSAAPVRVAFGADDRAGRNYDPPGRWPANILHDGSPEVLAVFPETGAASASFRGDRAGVVTNFGGADTHRGHDDSGGSAARFFYSAKASRAERELGLADFAPVSGQSVTGRAPGSAGAKCGGYAGTTESKRRNVHPTVKPVAAMRWLCRLATPSGGTILDPYTGSGTTGVAAALEGFEFIGCELSPEYVEIARARIAHAREFPAMWEPDYQAPDEVPAEQGSLF